MEDIDVARLIKYGLIAIVFSIVAFQRWLVNRKERKTQETIDVFELVSLYRKLYTKAYISNEDGINELEYRAAAINSEKAYRIQMGGHLQQLFSVKQMSAAIAERKVNAIYDGENLLPGLMRVAKEKAEENVKQIKAGLRNDFPDNQISTRRRRRRR